jgi:hypothetical protein
LPAGLRLDRRHREIGYLDDTLSRQRPGTLGNGRHRGDLAIVEAID